MTTQDQPTNETQRCLLSATSSKDAGKEAHLRAQSIAAIQIKARNYMFPSTYFHPSARRGRVPFFSWVEHEKARSLAVDQSGSVRDGLRIVCLRLWVHGLLGSRGLLSPESNLAFGLSWVHGKQLRRDAQRCNHELFLVF